MSRPVATLAPAALAMAVLAACSPGATPAHSVNHNARIVDAIKTDEVHWNNDWKSGDPARVAAHYAPDAVLMAPGAPPLAGAAAILRGIDEAFEQPGFLLSFTSDSVVVAAGGDLAASRGTWRMTVDDPRTKTPVTTTGAYVTLWKPQPGGAWKAVWDINTPGPANTIGLARR